MKNATLSLIQQLDQAPLLEGIETLSAQELDDFLSQLKMYAPILSEQRQLLHAHPTVLPSPFTAAHTPQHRALGERCLKQGKVGCLILAGGQGTRLGHDGPKGSVPVTCVTHKSLFEHLLDKVKAASLWAGHDLPVAMMTSPANHAQTLDFFKRHHWKSPSFFEQEMLPFIDEKGQWCLQKPGHLACGPDGNGHALHLFFSSGLFAQWKQRGIEWVNVIFIDNALADPFDVELVGLACAHGFDATLKALKRTSPQEAMGVLATHEGKLRVVEYSALPSSSPQFTLSSTGMFCFSMNFIHHLHATSAHLPLHLAHKIAPLYRGPARVGKCERFLFDLLIHARSSGALLAPRETSYAPLKNASGVKSLHTVQEALLRYDHLRYKELTGRSAAVELFELSAAFDYPSPELKKRLVAHPLKEGEFVDL